MNICIIGLGLIGGSFALALCKHSLAERIFGVDASPRNAQKALCEIISQHPHRNRFVAIRSMWGTEHSGPEVAVEGAFVGCNTVLREYIHQLEIFRKALEKDNREEIRRTIERVNRIRKVLDKK